MTPAFDVVLATDSAEPSGVGRMMLTLAGGLSGVRLLFADHAAGRALVAQARTRGLEAAVVADGAWDIAFRGAALVNVHAGIGWESHGLCKIARDSGAIVVRTEHLPWLLTDPGQVEEYKAALARVDGVITVSRASADSWAPVLAAMRPGLPLRSIPNGVLAARRDRVVPPVPTILCVARFTAQKNHSVLIHAMARLRRTHPDARLILAGSGPEEARIRGRIARHGVRAEILGPSDDVPGLMAGADVMVLPSAFEGLPLVVLEAMAAGCPVVATRIGGVTEALGDDHPWLVPAGDARALAAALAEALDRPDLRDRMAARQKARFAQGYTADRMAADTNAFFTTLLQTRQRTTPMTTRLGFIGAGGIAHRHFGVLEHMADVRIAAIADPDTGRAEEAGRRFGAAVFADHAAMLDTVELDAVFICVPPFAHGDVERACIARGLPFFVEKPLSLDLKLAEEISAEVEEAGLITAVGYHWRYLDTVDEARAQLAQNPAHLMTGFWLDQTPPPQWWWREDGSGGQVVEQATHVIDLARFLAGDVTEAFGLAARRDRPDFNGLTVPTATTASLRFASGAIANLSATCLLRWNHRVGLHVYADALAMEITDHDIMVDVGRGRPVRHAEGDPVWREDRDFIDAVQGKENRIRCPYAEALETHRVALAISQSAASGAVVKMEVLRSNPQPFFRETAS
ncbi:glycosyltransferase [Falsirhodobacter sp. 20TX0035]|uniref:glycosyltransferase n=1 Tax=Falsirhodobacter sp. 20TX0035 TaxID=3022019 RepID=UPI00232DD642|nr:glycosyltransferase [Falsirhodobacter sp. 20TX0035]MDB6452902.1 glycosyltransferase [Falsirhodobacter sp. 20TX0035]